jgi:hypothetical protein
MKNDTENKILQKGIFLISLTLVLLGVGMILIYGISEVFKFNTFIQPLTTKQQPYFIVMIFAGIALYYSNRNLKQITKQENKGVR